MPALADNDVVVHGNAGRGGEIDDRIWISAGNGEGSYFGDKTLRMNDTSGSRYHRAVQAAHADATEARWLADPHEQRAASFEAALCALDGLVLTCFNGLVPSNPAKHKLKHDGGSAVARFSRRNQSNSTLVRASLRANLSISTSAIAHLNSSSQSRSLSIRCPGLIQRAATLIRSAS